MPTKKLLLAIATICLYFSSSVNAMLTAPKAIDITNTVNSTIKPMIATLAIPGMAVAITIDNKTYFFNYGVMSKKDRQPITNKTLFEIGSVSKTFTATLLSSLVSSNKLRLSASVERYMPQLKRTAIGRISLLQLATHTSGLPLFPPKNIKTPQQFLQYLQNWKSPYPPGTERIYSNTGIELLGIIMTQITGESLQSLLNSRILKPLKMHNTFINVPISAYARYAEGYTGNNQPTRIPNKIPLPAAYGIRSCSLDLIHFVQANIKSINHPSTKLQHTINNTHISYYKTRYIDQGLVWEQYPFPVELKKILTGNKLTTLKTPTKRSLLKPIQNAWVNKSGSTDGFSTYIAYVPNKKIGIVLLTNKYYPIKQRVKMAYRILSQLSNLGK